MGGATASGNRNGDRWYSFTLAGEPNQFGIDVSSEKMQASAAEFGAFADSPTFIVAEQSA